MGHEAVQNGGGAAWTTVDNGVKIAVRLTPRAARDAVEGLVDLGDGRKALKARVRAVPENGKANQALIRLLARALDVPASHIELVDGGSSRLKTLIVSGDAAALDLALETACGRRV